MPSERGQECPTVDISDGQGGRKGWLHLAFLPLLSPVLRLAFDSSRSTTGRSAVFHLFSLTGAGEGMDRTKEEMKAVVRGHVSFDACPSRSPSVAFFESIGTSVVLLDYGLT